MGVKYTLAIIISSSNKTNDESYNKMLPESLFILGKLLASSINYGMHLSFLDLCLKFYH